ncbi:MAG TPA: type II toxin-antitoxin system RelE/ParE family toxin [Verrucomicrobiae bacterium]|jgi:toxin ParE1/3/4|nr:type II toxin-antitoxin system RelE/ParE family toxin [Verrucomicrobiae bacterium]
MAEIIWTEPALGDLDGIADYIALDKPDAASRLVRRVFERVELLAKHPELGPRIPELSRNSLYRQLVESPCRIFHRYERRAKKLYILGVVRGEKLFEKRLLKERDSRTRQ